MVYIKTYGLDEQAPGSAILPSQVHGSNIIELKTGEESLEKCDGIWTENRNLVLGIKHADCAPICFYNKKRFGTIHVGWRGLVGGIIEKAIEIFPREHSTGVFVGPFMHCFEIKKDSCYELLREKFSKFIYSESVDEKSEEYPEGKKYFFCFIHAIFHTLATSEYGNYIRNDSRNTFMDETLVSHRAKRGRTEKANNITIITTSKDNLSH